LFRSLTGVVGMIDHHAAWRRNTVPAQNVFALVLVDFHRARRFITAAALVLAPATAVAQIRDGNVVEYGIGTFNDAEGSLVMWPPKVKIFRDGRVLTIDEKGARQSRIDIGRVADLERDLLRTPLLQTTRWIEFARRKAMPNAGGISYIRSGEDVIVATPGIPLDSDWNAVIDRINSERPATPTPFRPQQLRFYVFDWPSVFERVAWPFASTVPLKGRGEDLVSTSDPAVIAFIIDATYNAKISRPAVEESGAFYQFGFMSAPGWTDPPAIQGCIEELHRVSPQHRGAGVQDGNLIEYGMGGFADGGHGPPMLYPPEVKVYNDGRIVFGTQEGYWQGTIKPQRLERLKRDLAKNDLLKKSQLLPVKNGGSISMHGGVAYIRYRDADDEIIAAVLSHPRRGPYVRLLARIREEIPETYSRFRPKEITFRLYPGSTWVAPVEWPFSATTPLHDHSDLITITDPAATAFVIDHSFGGFSWTQTNVRENGTDYEIIFESAPGWYEQEILGITLDNLRLLGSEP